VCARDLHGFGSATRFADDFKIARLAEQTDQAAPKQGVVVGD
jgi:hypothetical protein